MAKRQRTNMQARVRQMILDEGQKARELEQEIAKMQHEYSLTTSSRPTRLTKTLNISTGQPSRRLLSKG